MKSSKFNLRSFMIGFIVTLFFTNPILLASKIALTKENPIWFKSLVSLFKSFYTDPFNIVRLLIIIALSYMLFKICKLGVKVEFEKFKENQGRLFNEYKKNKNDEFTTYKNNINKMFNDFKQAINKRINESN